MKQNASRIPAVLKNREKDLLADWMKEQLSAPTQRSDLVKEADLREQSRGFLAAVQAATQRGSLEEIGGEAWSEVKDMVSELARERGRSGFTPGETASFVLSLKQPLFSQLHADYKADADGLVQDIWRATVLLDKLGLYAMEAYLQTREDIIGRQQRELLELSTPVVELWEDILALPLVGTLDSARTQIVMESLLQKIVDSSSSIAIIDITGVPTVDTLVAQHLLKTVAATRLMGADCIISGIRPQIAQTMVHLGVNLGEVTTKATLADAFRVALQRTGAAIGGRKSEERQAP